MIEPTFKVNSIGENLLYDGGRTKFAQIYTLICMKKGTDVLNPDKGVDINSYYYEFNKQSTLMDLERIIIDQITQYTPYKPYVVNCSSKLVDDKYIISIIITLQNQDDTIIIVSNGEESDFDIFRKRQ